MKLDHCAINVKNPEWYIGFFEYCFGMEILKTENDSKIWMNDGIQINKAAEDESCAGHVAFVVDNYDECLEKIYSYKEVHPSDAGYNWPCLPNGFVIEVLKPGGGIRF